MKSVFNTDKDIPVLTIGEYWCLFSEISEILNRRPTEAIMHEGTLRFICPNDLLLGRTTKHQPVIMSDTLDVKQRITLIEGIKENFWKSYLNVLAGNSYLLKYPCWYAQSRKPQLGDVVLVLYKTRVSESYRVGKILNIDKDKRNLDLLVSPPQVGTDLIIKNPSRMLVPIQRTVLLYSAHDEINDELKGENEKAITETDKKLKVNQKTNTENDKKLKISHQDNAPEIIDKIKRTKRGRPKLPCRATSNPKQQK